jgi:hypothetical protein
VIKLDGSNEQERNLIMDQLRAFVCGLFNHYALEHDFGCSDIEEHEYVLALTYAHRRNNDGQVERAALVSSKYRLLLIRKELLMNFDPEHPSEVSHLLGWVPGSVHRTHNSYFLFMY